MRRFAIIFVLAATLATSACGDAPPTSAGAAPVPAAVDRLDTVEARFAAARTIVDMVPLSPDQAAKVRTAETVVSTALAAARAALTLADRVAELRRANAAADRIDAATGIPTAAPALPGD